MTDSMVERVARALCTSHYRDRFGKPSTDPHVQSNVDGNWHLFAEDAMTAIEAIREPGLAIRKLTTFEFAEIEWPRLIDAALSQAQPTGEKPAQGTPA